MPKFSTKQQLKNRLANAEEKFAKYFSLLPELVEKISMPEPALAYTFQRIEAAQRMGRYALVLREYRTNPKLTMDTIDALRIERKEFPIFFERISGKSLPSSLIKKIAPAEKTRDAIMHGRSASSAEIHRAILHCLDYAEALNDEFAKKAGFRPVGGLSGVTSKKGKPTLEVKVSKAVLAGLKLIS